MGERFAAHRMRLLRGLLAAGAAALTLAAAAAAPAEARVEAKAAGLERSGLAEFSQTNVEQGSLRTTTRRAYAGKRSARAGYDGRGVNGFARGIQDVEWLAGETVTYGAAFYLPRGFKRRLAGAVSLMRWDNWPAYEDRGDVGGLVIYGSDRRLHLIRGGYDRGYEGDLIGGVPIPEGRWVHLEVRQRLSAGSDALSEVYLDGRLVGRSRKPNAYGRSIQRIRYGLVSMAAGAQRKRLSLYFDRATIGTELIGPVRGRR